MVMLRDEVPFRCRQISGQAHEPAAGTWVGSIRGQLPRV